MILGFQPTEVLYQAPESPVPERIRLYQNRPNPFNAHTNISFSVTDLENGAEVPISLKIYNVQGQFIKTLLEGSVGPGVYQTTWAGRDTQGILMNSGIYFCILRAGSWQDSKKLVLLR
jgi:flagellar hook assembly protein FlgD